MKRYLIVTMIAQVSLSHALINRIYPKPSLVVLKSYYITNSPMLGEPV